MNLFASSSKTLVSWAETLSRAGHTDVRPGATGIVLVGWNGDAILRCTEFLETELGALDGSQKVLVINNPDVDLTEFEGRRGWNVVRGSNRAGEFSGYEEGIARLQDPQILVLCNDRMLSYAGGATEAPLMQLVEAALSCRVAVGHVDILRTDVAAPTLVHIRTNFIVIRRALKEGIGSVIKEDPDDASPLLPVSYPGSDWIPERMQAESYHYLRTWLTEPSGWYRAQPLSATSWPLFRRKVYAVLNEHRLSADLLKNDIVPVSATQALSLRALRNRPEAAARICLEFAAYPALSFGHHQPGRKARVLTAAGILSARAHLDNLGVRLIRSAGIAASHLSDP